MLFADVKGSMDLAEQHDPEEWRRIMQGFFSILSDEVRRFEGTVDKFTGDGIMAVFGAPVAHEDHAQRACLAALRMLDDIAGYAARAAAHARAQLLRPDRDQLGRGDRRRDRPRTGDGDYTAIGHTVGLAQRMEALAEPGKAYLTEATAELARGFVELEDLGEFEIKGASRPVRVFELAGHRRGALAARPLARARLLALRRSRRGDGDARGGRCERARAGRGRGGRDRRRSRASARAASATSSSSAARADGIEVFEAQAQSHGREIPFMPMLQMLRAYFGIADADGERAVREKVAGRALLLDPEFADELPMLFDFLGVPDPARPAPQLSAEARQRALKAIVCRLVSAPERREPVVVVIEDLHWIDEGSAAMLGELFAAVEGTPTLVVVNFRPEYERRLGRAARLPRDRPGSRSGRPTRRSCCATWRARTPRSTGWPS